MEDSLATLKQRIAEVYARREAHKHALDEGALPARQGLMQLEVIDRELSDLDSRYKRLWDAAHPRGNHSG